MFGMDVGVFGANSIKVVVTKGKCGVVVKTNPHTLQAVRLKFYVYVSGYSAVLPVFSECVSVPRVHSESVCVWPCPQLLYPGAESVRITLTQ